MFHILCRTKKKQQFRTVSTTTLATVINTTYLISGTARGIGKGLVQSLLHRPNTTIIAGVRDKSAPAAQALLDLSQAQGSKLILVKLDSESATDAEEAVRSLQEEHGLTHLDNVLANAGIMPLESMAPAHEIDIDWVRRNFEVNTIGPILLFKATKPLLDRAKETKFIVTSTSLGSNIIIQAVPMPTLAHSVSKAAINAFVSKVHAENPNITAVAIHPGLVDTDLLAPYKHMAPMPPITVDESVSGFLKVVDGATKESASGKFMQWDGDVVPF